MISCFAPAKINLYLHILGRRDDGFHLIDSLVAFADFGDQITISSGGELALTITGAFSNNLIAENDNLVIRAAKLLAEHFNVKPEVKIHLSKNLPVASGLGGGSADAASTLVALLRYWNLSIHNTTLFKIAEQIGSDVPVCLKQHSCFVGGIGEKITSAPNLPVGWIVLVNACTPVSTREVFQRFSSSFSKPAPFSTQPSNLTTLAQMLLERSNDLTEAAIGVSPVIKVILEAISKTKGVLLTRLSGSGGTCFGLFELEEQATLAANTLKNEQPNWWVQSTSLLKSK